MNRYIKIIVFSFFTTIIYAMNEQSSFIEQDALQKSSMAKLNSMPPEVIGNILHHLNYQIGCKDFINQADFAVVIKNSKNLAYVNKELYRKVNNLQATSIFIESLAQRFHMNPLDVAVTIKTQGSLAWLLRYAHESGDYEQFEVLQQIFSICSAISQQAQAYNLDVEYGQLDDPGSNSFEFQTEQGFMLVSENARNALCTPWGQVTLLTSYDYLDFLTAEQKLLEKLSTTFDCVMSIKSVETQCKLIQLLDVKTVKKIKFKDICKKIAYEDINESRSQQIIIPGNFSYYQIHAVQDINLPVCKLLQKCNYKSYEVVKALWNLMDNEFHKRPLDKPRDSLEVDFDQEVQAVDFSPYQVFPSIKIENINQLIAKYIVLIADICNQPEFQGQGSVAQHTKIFICKDHNDYIDSKIIEILTGRANGLLSKDNQWFLYCFGVGIYDFYLYEKCLGHGLEYRIYDKNMPCSLDMLQEKYQIVLQNFKVGWQHALLQDYQDILCTQSEEEYYLFIKQTDCSDEEALLMDILAHKFHVHEKIICQNYWQGEKKLRSMTYLWVEKNALQEIKTILDLDLQMTTLL